MRGFKAFGKNLTCDGKQYEIGSTYEFDGEPIPCERGFDFHKSIVECYEDFPMPETTRICLVEATGDIVADDETYCTNKITIIEEIAKEWVFSVNSTGNRNTGDCNAGDKNSGDWNEGNYNTGDWNEGNWNAGNWNAGNFNTGDWNTGCCNTGDYNSGNRNSGVFNTETPTLTFFDKPSDWTLEDWLYSDAKKLLNRIKCNLFKWVCSAEMTDAEKEEHPEHETTGGYLKAFSKKDSAQIWWDSLTEKEREVMYSLPNFDKDKFCRILGITIS